MIKKNHLKWDFASGPLAGHLFHTYRIEGLSAFLTMACGNGEPFLCGVELDENDPELLVSFNGQGLAVFVCDGTLQTFVEDGADIESGITGIVDDRHNLIYFLPGNAYVAPKRALEIVGAYFAGNAPSFTDVPQATDETYAIYEKLLAKGEVHI